jgi:hypothetical protein
MLVKQSPRRRQQRISPLTPALTTSRRAAAVLRRAAMCLYSEIEWREIVTGERLAGTEALRHDIRSIMDRALEALLTIETASARILRLGRPVA